MGPDGVEASQDPEPIARLPAAEAFCWPQWVLLTLPVRQAARIEGASLKDWPMSFSRPFEP